MGETQVSYKQLFQKLEKHGQEHVLRWWDDLTESQRDRLAGQILSMDLDLVTRLKEEVLHAPPRGDVEGLSPAPVIKPDAQEAAKARAAGEEHIRAGKIAALTVAGGQGSRLGFEGPKGLFPICPVSGNSFFQLFAERLRAVGRRFGVTIPWYIMTSDTSHDPTLEFFEKHRFFGLRPDDVTFFRQGMLPALDLEGRLLLDAKDHVFTSPNGHGGTLQALRDSGALDDMKRRGIEDISYFQVDNVLIKVVDPVFIGCHRLADSEMSIKVVQKRDPEEGLGVVGILNGRVSVVEYSELSREDKYASGPDGRLLYRTGSIAVHVLSVAFVERLTRSGFSLPYHRAEKNVPFLNEQGELERPSEKNAVKFEMFVFDALGEARNPVILEVKREEEFSPVKYPTGDDSIESARRDLSNMYGRWLREAGVEVPFGDDGNVKVPVEISPLFALDAEELARKIRGRTITFEGPVLLEEN